MRRFAILVLLLCIASAAPAEKPVTTQMLTVDQLQKFLSVSRGLKDKELAKQIYNSRLTERLNDAKRATLLNELPGPKSQQALTALADESEFLELPPAEIPANDPPTLAEQDAILARMVEYVTHTMHRLPDLYATRLTTGFFGTTMAIPRDAHNAILVLNQLSNDQRLSPVLKSKLVVLYRNGRDSYANKKKRVASECKGIDGAVSGEFGEILVSVPEIVAQNHMTWIHWERHGELLLAVFQYSAILPFQDDVNCPHEIKIPTRSRDFEYQGEIAVNPEDGSILRITRSMGVTMDWWGNGLQTMGSRKLASYGSIEIGGKTYICPMKAIYIVQESDPEQDTPAERASFDRLFHLPEDPVQETLDDMTYSEYHLFRSYAHILTGSSQTPETEPSNSAPANPHPTGTPREK